VRHYLNAWNRLLSLSCGFEADWNYKPYFERRSFKNGQGEPLFKNPAKNISVNMQVNLIFITILGF